jgi:hypothetical protein
LPEEETIACRITATCGLRNPIQLDMALQCEAMLRIEDVLLKLGSLLFSLLLAWRPLRMSRWGKMLVCSHDWT